MTQHTQIKAAPQADYLEDGYEFYTLLCEGKNPPAPERPQQLFFRSRFTVTGVWLPAWIAWDAEAEQFRGYRGFAPDAPGVETKNIVHEVSALSVWPWAADNWVTHEDFEVAYHTGEWPGAAPTLTGTNAPTEDHAGLKAAIEDQSSEALAWLKKCGPELTKEQGDKAADWQKNINELKLKADKLFRAEKDPINEQATAVDERWRFRKKAETAMAALKKAWEAVAQRLEAEKQAAAKKALDEGAKPEDLKPVEKVKLGGTSSGGGKSLRTVPTCVVKDLDTVLGYLRDTPGFRALVETHVQALHKAGVEVPGTTIENRKVA